MVKLAEWRGKEVFRKYGVPLPKGQVARSPGEAESLTRSGAVPLPCVVKAQVLSGGRGKGGAVKFANSPEEARTTAEAILALEFKGEKVRELLLEEKLSIAQELYLSFTLDRSLRVPTIIASAQGGVEIESVDDAAIERVPVHPFPGLAAYEKRRIAQALGDRKSVV
jgi:succinyl-CoA synthetase beta subunit